MGGNPVKVFLVTIAAIFAAVPGLSTLVTQIGAPPGRKEMYAAILTFAGCLTLASVYVCRAYLRNRSAPRVVAIAGLIAVVSLVGFAFYTAVFREYCSVRATKTQYEDYQPVYFPFCLSGDMDKKVREKGSRAAILDEYGPEQISGELEHMPGVAFARAVTDIVLLLWYGIVIVGFTLAFAMVGFYQYDT